MEIYGWCGVSASHGWDPVVPEVSHPPLALGSCSPLPGAVGEKWSPLDTGWAAGFEQRDARIWGGLSGSL